MKAFASHSEASYRGHQTGMASFVDGKLRCNYVDSQGRVFGYVDEEIRLPSSFHGFGRHAISGKQIFISGHINRNDKREIDGVKFVAVVGPRGGLLGFAHDFHG